jgi:hypothetical protein
VIELITGCPPFFEDSPLTAAYKIVEEDIRKQIPAEISSVSKQHLMELWKLGLIRA